jgi:hypothetical protein
LDNRIVSLNFSQISPKCSEDLQSVDAEIFFSTIDEAQNSLIIHGEKMKIKVLIIIASILLSGCVPYAGRPIVYEAEKSDSVFPFYVDGNPVLAVVTPNSIFQSSIGYSYLATHNYIRMWMSYTNYLDEPVLFNPMEAFTLTQINLTKGEELIHVPVFPSRISNSVQNEKQAALIANAFVGIAEAASTTPTTYYQSTGMTIQADDLKDKLNAINQNNAHRAREIADSYDYYMRSVNSFLVKKNTVFPSQTVSGFVYFEINGTGGQTHYSPEDNKFVLTTNFSDLEVTVQFNPVEGY